MYWYASVGFHNNSRKKIEEASGTYALTWHGQSAGQLLLCGRHRSLRITENVEHHAAPNPQRRAPQREAQHRSKVVLELVAIARLVRVVARVVRSVLCFVGRGV